MKNLIELSSQLALLTILLTCLISCKRNHEDPLRSEYGSSPDLTISPAVATLSTAQPEKVALTVSWTRSVFRNPVLNRSSQTFTLQIFKTGSPNPIFSMNMGEALKRSFTYKELNDLLAVMDCHPGKVGSLTFRLWARTATGQQAKGSAVSEDINTTIKLCEDREVADLSPIN